MFFIIPDKELCAKCKTENSVEVGIDFEDAKIIRRCSVCGETRKINLFKKNKKWNTSFKEEEAFGSVYLYNENVDLYEYMTLKEPLNKSQLNKLEEIFDGKYMNLDKSSVTTWDDGKSELQNIIGVDILSLISDEDELNKITIINDYNISLDEWLESIISNDNYSEIMKDRYEKKIKEYDEVEKNGIKRLESLFAVSNFIFKPDSISEIEEYIFTNVHSEPPASVESILEGVYEIHKKYGRDIEHTKSAIYEWLDKNITIKIFVDDDSPLSKIMGALARKITNEELDKK